MENQYQIITKDQLDQFINKNWNDLNNYLDDKMASLPIPFYTSIDIRESTKKYAPVDNNIYPAGFNNLCLLDLDASSRAIKAALLKVEKSATNIGVIPESHTSNRFYLDHLAVLGKTISDSGFNVTFLSPDENLFEKSQNQIELVSHSGFDVTIHKASLQDGHFRTSGLEKNYDILILNNDQSSPLQIDWENVVTPVIPTPKIGWFSREKSNHFHHYGQVVTEFCQKFSIDPNLMQAKFKSIENIDFIEKSGLDQLAEEVDLFLSELPEESRVFIKASQGTYGMGISVVKSGKEIIEMNRKARNKMNIGKNNIKFSKVLIQESVETILKYDDMPAEVTIYLVDGRSVGGFMRANSQKDSHSNLNSRGMVFKKFCISEIRQGHDHMAKEATYSILARLSTLASAYEIKSIL